MRALRTDSYMQLIKEIIFLVIITVLTGLYGQERYRHGVEDTKFDREAANIKLQNCSEVIAKFEL